MSDTVTIICPECDLKLKAPAAAIGKKIKCKGCSKVFVAEEAFAAKASAKAAAKPAKAAPKAAPPKKEEPAAKNPHDKPTVDDEDANPYGLTETVLSYRCPHCANAMESEDAKICLNCGYNTETREQGKTKKIEDRTFMDCFLWLLPGILCAILVIGLALGDIWVWMQGAEFAAGTWYEGAYGGLRLWGTIVIIFAIVGFGRFAVKRLIFDNSPPEVERH
jgi:hypothetical protein